MAERKTTRTQSKAAHGAHARAAAPWDRPNPKGAKRHQHLSPEAKADAKRMAEEAGRPYPNLVDNMRAAKKAKKK